MAAKPMAAGSIAAKSGLIPRPGILDIAPYVPGTSALPGSAPVVKLSSNETPLGPSPAAVEAYRDHLRHTRETTERALAARRPGSPPAG